MTVKLRISGDREEIDQLLGLVASVVELAGAGRTYPNRDGFGVRTYLEARVPACPQAPVRVYAERGAARRLPAGEHGQEGGRQGSLGGTG